MKSIFGALSVALTAGLYVPYWRNFMSGKTTPHVFTWFVWGVVAFIVCAAQIVSNAGAGAWFMGIEVVGCTAVFVGCMVKRQFDIERSDWYAFAGAGVAAIAWLITRDPLWSVIFATLTEVLAFIPTVRKSWTKPYEEPVATYAMSSVACVFSVLALREFTLTGALDQSVWAVGQLLFAVTLVMRRRMLPPVPVVD